MKKYLLTFLICLCGITNALATVIHIDVKNNEELSDLFVNTTKQINTNPQKINSIISDINSSSEFSNILTNTKDDKVSVTNKNINFESKIIIDALNKKILNDTRFVTKIILSYGQSKKFAKNISTDDDIKTYLIQKNLQDINFRIQIFNLLTENEKKKLTAI